MLKDWSLNELKMSDTTPPSMSFSEFMKTLNTAEHQKHVEHYSKW